MYEVGPDDTVIFELQLVGSTSCILAGSEYANFASGCKFREGGTVCGSIMCLAAYGRHRVI